MPRVKKTKKEAPPKLVLADADVLIDFVTADRRVLTFLAKTFDLHVAQPILQKEVIGLDEEEVEKLGMGILLPSVEEMQEAQKRLPGVSANDTLCFVMVRNRGWACMTNDRRLRGHVAEAGLEAIWGLRAMLISVAAGDLKPELARKTAETIHATNRAHIGKKILQDFVEKLELIKAGEEWDM